MSGEAEVAGEAAGHDDDLGAALVGEVMAGDQAGVEGSVRRSAGRAREPRAELRESVFIGEEGIGIDHLQRLSDFVRPEGEEDRPAPRDEQAPPNLLLHLLLVREIRHVMDPLYIDKDGPGTGVPRSVSGLGLGGWNQQQQEEGFGAEPWHPAHQDTRPAGWAERLARDGLRSNSAGGG